jgi:sigma-E factor negative regulatory protein RseC
MEDRITHSGVIEKIGERCITVRIDQTAACAGCKVSGHCNASEHKEKLIEIYGHDGTQRHVGEQVMVSADVSTGYRAVGWGFGIPLVLIIAVLFTVHLLTGNDGLAALAGLAALIPYYIILYLLRHKIRERLTFQID